MSDEIHQHNRANQYNRRWDGDYTHVRIDCPDSWEKMNERDVKENRLLESWWKNDFNASGTVVVRLPTRKYIWWKMDRLVYTSAVLDKHSEARELLSLPQYLALVIQRSFSLEVSICVTNSNKKK